ncbi:MAG: hypothetical protein U0930_20280 [Pirellulales bacterium]
MNRTIFINNCRQSLWATLGSCVGIALFVVLFIWSMQTMGPQLMEFLSSVGFLRKMLELAFGFTLDGEVSSNTLYSIAWLHPVVLALSWGTLIATATRQTSGEMERGRTELTISLPLSRGEIFWAGWFCTALVSVLVSVAPLIGLWVGSQLFEPFEPIRFGRFAIASFNLWMLNVAVGSLTTLIGVRLVRRGVAVATVSSILILFVAMNFLESFLVAIQKIKFVSLLYYYRPGDIVRSEQWPIYDTTALFTISTVASIVAAVLWQRRDMPVP